MAHLHAVADAHAHESAHFERDQRLAHRGARHTELFGQFALGRQVAARRKIAGLDHRTELVGDLLVEAAVLNRLDGHTSGLVIGFVPDGRAHRTQPFAPILKVRPRASAAASMRPQPSTHVAPVAIRPTKPRPNAHDRALTSAPRSNARRCRPQRGALGRRQSRFGPALDDRRHFVIRRGQQAHGPVRPEHQPLRAERVERRVETLLDAPDVLPAQPALPVGLGHEPDSLHTTCGSAPSSRNAARQRASAVSSRSKSASAGLPT